MKDRWSKLPTWGKWTIGVVGVFIVLGVGAAIGGSNEDDLKSEVSSLESQVENAQDERDAADARTERAEAEAARIRAQGAKIVSEAEAEADELLSGAKREADEAEENLGSLKSEVASTESELADVEGSLDGAREEKAKSKIPGDGTFKSEADYIPGTYRSEGGSTCYWATLNSADPYDIASNENATGPTIASITTPYFNTSGCGAWERISE